MSEAVPLTAPKATRLRYVDHVAVILRSPKTFIRFWVAGLVLAAAFYIIDIVMADCRCPADAEFNVNVIWIVGLLGSLGFLVVTPLISHWRVRRLMKGSPIVLQLLSSGIKTVLPSAEGVSYWSALKRVVTSNDRLFLFISGCSAFVVPRRDFDDVEEFRQWSALATERFAEAKAR